MKKGTLWRIIAARASPSVTPSGRVPGGQRGAAIDSPRGVLKEFGVEIPEKMEVRVWDSSAEQRYIVIPQRPAGTEKMSEEQLAELVTRDSMIGVGLVKARA